jgi:DMSO/TMAO reductase YedYZ molybdopterin-dependent catalytic subunit
MTQPASQCFQVLVDKATPSAYFTYRFFGGREMNFAPVCEIGLYVPNERYYVHNRVAPPKIDTASWTLTVTGQNLSPATFTYAELRGMPAVSVDRTTDCAANGRSFFPKLPHKPDLHHQPISGSEWRFGAMGMGRWTGVRMSSVLMAAGVNPARAKWVLVTGSDIIQGDHYVAIRGNVSTLKRQGKSLEETIAAKPTAVYDAKWGQFLMTPAIFTRQFSRVGSEPGGR